ncbi:hypothetical protein [Bacillus sp. FJAT-45037]|uniref:hypothetical protein n=1 Tax=Bacillus sp. FJAT-45037 TaxID=2011007 RepID=UPI000C232907|nr:hypothetical protein [Bacillus sp. FJAT-45037]
MSPNGLRGLAGGMVLASGIIWATYALSPTQIQEPITIVEQEELEVAEMMTRLQEAGYYVAAEEPTATADEEPVTEEPVVEEAPTEEVENLPENVSVDTVNVYTMTLSITAGTSSADVANQLENAMIIESASDFLSFLEQNNLAEKVRAGDFEVSSTMSFRDIVNRIT